MFYLFIKVISASVIALIIYLVRLRLMRGLKGLKSGRG